MEDFFSYLYLEGLNYWYDEAIDCIAQLIENYPKNENRLKYISLVLNESNININNKKYYDFSNLVNLVDGLGIQALKIMEEREYQKLKLNVGYIVNRVTGEYSGIINIFIKDRIELNEREKFCNDIKKNTDLYEELINYILNDEKFENVDDLIKIEGYNVLDILETTDLNVAECYQYLMDLREKKKVNLNKLFK